jgi:hypothetical protein
MAWNINGIPSLHLQEMLGFQETSQGKETKHYMNVRKEARGSGHKIEEQGGSGHCVEEG